MIKKGYILSEKETAEVFYILLISSIKLTGKVQTQAKKYHKDFEKALGLEIPGLDEPINYKESQLSKDLNKELKINSQPLKTPKEAITQ